MIIHVRVKPGSRKDSFEKINNNEYLICTSEKAVDGKANLEVIKTISKEFNVHYSRIQIKNPKSRLKIIEIIK